MRVKYTVMIDTAITENGTMKISHAVASAETDVPVPAARLATLACTIPAPWLTATMANSQPAARPVWASPTPRQRKSGRKLRPVRRQKKASTPACAATPNVEEPARTATIVGVHTSGEELTDSPPKRLVNTTKPPMATTLFTTGAQVNGPKTLRAFSTSPTRL